MQKQSRILQFTQNSRLVSDLSRQFCGPCHQVDARTPCVSGYNCVAARVPRCLFHPLRAVMSLVTGMMLCLPVRNVMFGEHHLGAYNVTSHALTSPCATRQIHGYRLYGASPAFEANCEKENKLAFVRALGKKMHSNGRDHASAADARYSAWKFLCAARRRLTLSNTESRLFQCPCCVPKDAAEFRARACCDVNYQKRLGKVTFYVAHSVPLALMSCSEGLIFTSLRYPFPTDLKTRRKATLRWCKCGRQSARFLCIKRHFTGRWE
ncbi:hypothetical protein FVE85_1897 [Porphyridium purpureum]|uniref:Uncharacterized protein n=1 Tax=Porphyridium purpureum TaxID=35688 RepID=A0A5J4YY02_PORPP|nr:hypothetical protein FVE85_1897 [Porphyridium purpureum]|eukprot:POR7252..scf209_3